MCIRPLTIPNPAYVKNRVCSRSTIEVPCGHCEECKDAKRLSWFVRLYYEWQYCISNGGFTLVETLTYNNSHIPILLKEYDIMDRGLFKCFSRRDVQLYIKKIRSKLKKIYGKNVDFKYFLSMEFGGRLHRPHYHIVFFVDSPLIDKWLFKRIVENLWHENGFTKAGKLNHGFVINASGLSYVSKYVCKDCYEDSYLRIIDNRLAKCGFDREQYKDLFPRVMLSKNLGFHALEFDKYNDLDNFFNGEIYLPDTDNILRKYKLPLYYERKIFYNTFYRFFDNNCNDYILVHQLSDVPLGCDFSPVYVLNDLGLEMKEFRAQKQLDAVVNVYRVTQSLPELPTILKRLNEKFNKKYPSLSFWKSFISKNLPEELFVNYSLVYRGCKINHTHDISTACGCENAFYDYMLIHNINRGVRPLSVDFNNLCYNIDFYNKIPFIEDNYRMIRYVYYLCHLELENDKIRKDLSYNDQKSVYLSQLENV